MAMPFEADARELNWSTMGINTIINALSVTQAFVWSAAIGRVIAILLPESEFSAAGAVVAAIVTSFVCMFLIAMTMRCFRLVPAE